MTSHVWTSRATAAVPPLAAAAALAVGLGVLKRVVAARTPESVASDTAAPEELAEDHASIWARLWAWVRGLFATGGSDEAELELDEYEPDATDVAPTDGHYVPAPGNEAAEAPATRWPGSAEPADARKC